MSSTSALRTPFDSGAPAPDSGAGAGAVVRSGLDQASRTLAALEVPTPEWRGKLLRPLVAYALVPPHRRGQVDHRFWLGACAVQMIHEASLLHDDIVDQATERRGTRTLAHRKGVGAALVLGDHFLTGAYRAAAAVESSRFLDVFIQAVERTVDGEVRQSGLRGRRVAPDVYEQVIAGKSGELFGASAALGGAVMGDPDLDARVRFGRELGSLYQRVDDLLDFCCRAETGKQPLQDYRQKTWTWVMDLAGLDGFSEPEGAVLEAIFGDGENGPSPARRALDLLLSRRVQLLSAARELSPGDDLLPRVMDGWVHAAVQGVERQEAATGGGRPHRGTEVGLPDRTMKRPR